MKSTQKTTLPHSKLFITFPARHYILCYILLFFHIYSCNCTDKSI